MTPLRRFLTVLLCPAVLLAAALVGTAGAQEPPRWYESTSYCCVGRGGGYCGRTASGVQVGPGQVAADPRVLPLGSRIWVDGYGEATVTDTGGAIRGHRIDVFFYRCEDAWTWGRRHVLVSHIEPESVGEQEGEA